MAVVLYNYVVVIHRAVQKLIILSVCLAHHRIHTKFGDTCDRDDDNCVEMTEMMMIV